MASYTFFLVVCSLKYPSKPSHIDAAVKELYIFRKKNCVNVFKDSNRYPIGMYIMSVISINVFSDILFSSCPRGSDHIIAKKYSDEVKSPTYV